MPKPRTWALIFLLVLGPGMGGPGCRKGPESRPGEAPVFIPHSLPAGASLSAEKNGTIGPRSWEFTAEALGAEGLTGLRDGEGLKATAGEGDEFTRMIRVLAWTYRQWPSSVPDPYPPWNAVRILEMIRAGRTGGFCAQYAVVLAQSLLALGYEARYLALDGEPSRGGHVSVEAWSDQFNQWVALDPYFGCYYERKANPGRPLSALEIHEALVSGRAGEIEVKVAASGDKNRPAAGPDAVKFFFHLAVDMRNDHLSRPNNTWNQFETYLSWQDNFTNGRPEFFARFTRDPLDFNFPLNQVQFSIQRGRAPGEALVILRSNMPDVYEIKVARDQQDPLPYLLDPYPAGGPSSAAPAGTPAPAFETILSSRFGILYGLRLQLRPGSNRLAFQAVNREGVEGPEASFDLNFNPNSKSSSK